MQLTHAQWGFLTDLRHGPCAAIAGQDASVIGPLIRAGLVAWTDDVAGIRWWRPRPAASFALTMMGAMRMADHDAATFG